MISAEAEILDIGARVRIIERINSQENKNRKDESYKRYLGYKDKTYLYVLKKMLLMFKLDTVIEMSYAIANISFVRKIIDKLARVYSSGVTREVYSEEDEIDEDLTQQIQELAKLKCMDPKMQNTNRANKRDKNTLFYVKPQPVLEDGQDKYDVDLCPLFPFLYDVVERPQQREKPMVVILSHYCPPDLSLGPPIQNEEQAARHNRQASSFQAPSTSKEAIPDDFDKFKKESERYIWWSDSYHFTTDGNGEMVQTGGDGVNPIQVLPFVNFAEDQDGTFWATGGDDLIDGAILLNSMISHSNHIGIVQGYGQLYMTGKNLPKNVKVGPNSVIRLEYDAAAEESAPQIGFLNANPPLADLKAQIEMFCALLLTTNNLSVSGVATQLGGAATPAAGISLIIDKAESMEDVSDQAQIFKDNEPLIWRLMAKWMNYYKGKQLLVSNLVEFDLPEDIEVQLKFGDPKPIMTEKEKLDNLKLRDELGLNTKEELMMMDDPSLTKEQASKKLLELTKQKMIQTAQAVDNAVGGNGNQDNGQPGDTEQNSQRVEAGPVGYTEV